MGSYNQTMESTSMPMKWATMIPKIGGSALGCYQATSTLPLYHLSYTPFKQNDSQLARYWPQVPFFYLDQAHKVDKPIPTSQFGEIDFVTAVCPCSGLSMLNTAQTGKAGRGSDAAKNDWMLDSAVWVLENVKPKVLMGENAPALFTATGEKVVSKLRDIAHKFGYSFSLLKTNTELHGLPQKRIRTFYFFWRSPFAPLLSWKSTSPSPLVEYLKEIPANASMQDVFIHEGVASQRYRPYQYVLEREKLSHKEFSMKFRRGTVAKYLEKNSLMMDCIHWLRRYYPQEKFSSQSSTARTHIQVLEHMNRKLGMGLGYWDDSIKFMGESFTAVIKKNLLFAIHPVEDRFFNVRELLHLMGMPHDFELDDVKNINHVCQTVPVNTARDWAEEVVKFCRGDLELSDGDFVKQDNMTQQVLQIGENKQKLKKRKTGD